MEAATLAKQKPGETPAGNIDFPTDRFEVEERLGYPTEEERASEVYQYDGVVNSPDDDVIFSAPSYSRSMMGQTATGTVGGSEPIKYLKPGQPSPLKVWRNLLVAEDAELADGIEGIGNREGQCRRPLLAVVTHYLEGSNKLKEAAVEMATKLPRRSFAADLAVVCRDPWGATAKLAKLANGGGGGGGGKQGSGDGGGPVAFLSAHRNPQWPHAYGVSSQLVEFGVSVFVIERSTGLVFAVGYNCAPENVVLFLKRAVAAFKEQHKQQEGPASLASSQQAVVGSLEKAGSASGSAGSSASQRPKRLEGGSKPQDNLVGKLQELADLKAQGALSEEEFTKAKSKILNM
jgi:hypothetical protein